MVYCSHQFCSMGKLGPEEKDIAGVYEARSFDFESFSLILRSRLSYLNVDILCLYILKAEIIHF